MADLAQFEQRVGGAMTKNFLMADLRVQPF